MTLAFNVSAIVSRPVHDVYESVADPSVLSRYFTTGGARGRLDTGKTVTWEFADFPGPFPVHVVVAQQDKRIVFEWASGTPEAATSGKTMVTFLFEPLGEDRTRVRVEESGFAEGPAGQKAAFDNCMGWSQMLAALKAWVEYQINLRDGMYA